VVTNARTRTGGPAYCSGRAPHWTGWAVDESKISVAVGNKLTKLAFSEYNQSGCATPLVEEPPATTIRRLRAYAAAGILLFSLTCAGTLAWLVDRHCGSEFNYYGCDAPPVARGPSRALALKH
jgi:hypothetical protein